MFDIFFCSKLVYFILFADDTYLLMSHKNLDTVIDKITSRCLNYQGKK